MSQYPSSPQPPYPTPPVGYHGYGAPAPGSGGNPAAKRASILMIVLGVLMLLMGGCLGVTSRVLPSLDLPAESRAQFEQLKAQLPPGISLETMMLVYSVMLVVAGIIGLALGILVRGGSRGWLITSVVVTSLALIYLVLSSLGALVLGGNVSGLCVVFPVIGAFALLMSWLVQALRAGPSLSPADAAMRQYQAQMWYYQQQQAYQQQMQFPPPPGPGGYFPPPPPQQSAGYGYGQPQQQAPPQQQQQPTPQWRDPNAPPPEG